MKELAHWDLAEVFQASEVCALMLGKEPSENVADFMNNPIFKTIVEKSRRTMDLLIRHANAFYNAPKEGDDLAHIWLPSDYEITYARKDITPTFIKNELDLIVNQRIMQDDKWITSVQFWNVWNDMRNTLHIRDVMQPAKSVYGFSGFELLPKYGSAMSGLFPKFSRDEIIRWIEDNNLTSQYDFSLGQNCIKEHDLQAVEVLGTKERNTLLSIIYALTLNDIDLDGLHSAIKHDAEALKTDTASKIKQRLERKGIVFDAKTIREHIKKAHELNKIKQ